MKTKEMVCVVCPNGCQMRIEHEAGIAPRVTSISGKLCEKGVAWAEQELTNPVRTIASSIVVDGGDLPLVSVRTDTAIPLERIQAVMKVIKSARATAPLHIGDRLIKGPAGTACNVIATRNVNGVKS